MKAIAIRTREFEFEPEGISIGSQGILIGSLGQAAVLFTLFFDAAERTFDISNL
jgi:hypothetical protein